MDALDNNEILHALQKSLAKKRVLIVDRHTAARDSLRVMLGSLGVTTVHGAGTSAEVIRQVHGNRFDIILSDFILDDGRDGQQLLEELRFNHMIPLGTVYIIITSESSHSSVVSLAELAPDDYLIKPFTADLLQSRLLRAIYRKHVLRHIYGKIERGSLQEAIAACDHVMAHHPPYVNDALRFKGEALHTLGRHEEAEALYQQILASRAVPWAKMGLAMAIKERGRLADAEKIVRQLNAESPDFLAAYDFLATILEAEASNADAQKVLQQAAEASPNNSQRQRMVGDIAMRNADLESAEAAYARVLARQQGASLKSVDDFANLARVLLEKGDVEGARKVTATLKKDCRGDRQADLAGLILDSLSAQVEGDGETARQLAEQAVALRKEIGKAIKGSPKSMSQRLAIDLAHTCFVSGMDDVADKIMRKVAAENNDDAHLIDRIGNVFDKIGRPEAGKALLAQVSAEIIELNNRGVMAARAGNLEDSVNLLIQTAEQVPNLQFLVNATKAIFTLLDRKGWDEDLAETGRNFLLMAIQKDRRSPKVASAREVYATVAKKYGIEPDFSAN